MTVNKEKIKRMKEIASIYGAELLENSRSFIVDDEGNSRDVTEKDFKDMLNFEEIYNEIEIGDEVVYSNRKEWEIRISDATFNILDEKVA